MKAVKGNIQITLANEAEAPGYAAQGYDICNDDGVITLHAAGKKVSYAQHEQLLAEHEQLLAEHEQLLAEQAAAEGKTDKELKKDLVAANKRIAELEAQVEQAAAPLTEPE